MKLSTILTNRFNIMNFPWNDNSNLTWIKPGDKVHCLAPKKFIKNKDYLVKAILNGFIYIENLNGCYLPHRFERAK